MKTLALIAITIGALLATGVVKYDSHRTHELKVQGQHKLENLRKLECK